MTYDIESKLRAHLTGLGWYQCDIAAVVSQCGTLRTNTFARAKHVASRWLENKRQYAQHPSRKETRP
jgi:S-ribosylhomocysteine lyase LuxS involved in autoinducer biosynthesis